MMNDSFGLLPKTQRATEGEAYDAGDPKAFDVADAEEQLEVCS